MGDQTKNTLSISKSEIGINGLMLKCTQLLTLQRDDLEKRLRHALDETRRVWRSLQQLGEQRQHSMRIDRVLRIALCDTQVTHANSIKYQNTRSFFSVTLVTPPLLPFS